jgi:hypothetical protein
MYREFRCINLNTEHPPALIFLPTHSTNWMWLLISYSCHPEDISRPRNWAVDMENIRPRCDTVSSGWITGTFHKTSAANCAHNDVQKVKFYPYIRNFFHRITLSLLKPDIYELSVLENLSKPVKNVQGVSSSAWTDGRTNRNDEDNSRFSQTSTTGCLAGKLLRLFRYFFRVPPRAYAQTPPLLYWPNPTQP